MFINLTMKSGTKWHSSFGDKSDGEWESTEIDLLYKYYSKHISMETVNIWSEMNIIPFLNRLSAPFLLIDYGRIFGKLSVTSDSINIFHKWRRNDLVYG